MHFNSKLKILSIHYYDSPYSHVDCNGLKSLQRYIDYNVVGNNPVGTLSASKVLLKRNAKALHHSKNRAVHVTQRITHKSVTSFLTHY